MSGPISFARGAPAPEALSEDLVAECASRALAADGKRLLSYGNGQGYPPLRELLAAQHGVDPAQIFVTNGSLQGFALLLDELLDPGDLVAVEAPTYDRALLQLKMHGMRVLPIPLDDDGLVVDELAAACERGDVPKLLYTIPNFQNPSGATLSAPRRSALLEVCERHGILVLEDDPYGRLRFEGDPIPGLHEQATVDRVMFTSSFSKTVAPGLRVGYLVMPKDLVARISKLANDTYISPALLAQGAIHQLVANGHLEGNIERVTRLMKARRDAMVAGLGHLPAGTRCTPPKGGFFLWLELPEQLSADDLFAPASEAGIAYVRGSDCFLEGGERTLRLAYSGVGVDEIGEGMARLGEVFSVATTPTG